MDSLKEKYAPQLRVLKSMCEKNGLEYPEKYEDNLIIILENIRRIDFKDSEVKKTILNGTLIFMCTCFTKMDFDQFSHFIRLAAQYTDGYYPSVFQGHARDEYTKAYDMWQQPLKFYKSLNLEGNKNEICTD